MLKSTFNGLQRRRRQWVYLHLFSCCCPQICEIQRHSVKIRTYSSSRSSKVIDLGVNQKRICDFLLVINNNFGLILAFSRYRRLKLEMACFSHPSVVCCPRSGNPLEFLSVSYPAKTRRRGYRMVKMS